ncbi:MAG: hypothetical protein ACREFL_17155 [Stellaceae bacterium]
MIVMHRAFLILALALAWAVPAHAGGLFDAPLSYSATRTLTVDGKTYTGRMFHIPGRERHDQELLGMTDIFILDGKQESGFVVLPGLRTMIQFPFPALLAALNDPALEKTPQGEESVDGIAAAKYRIDETAPDRTRAAGFAWISRRGVLMKLSGTIAAPGGHRTRIEMTLSGLKEGPQSAALFTPPPGLTVLPATALAPLLGFKLQ